MTTLDQLENDTEASRVRVAELLDELRGRVSPGELVDQVVDFAGNGAVGDFARGLGRQVRGNPMAVVLIGAGLAWLVTADRRGGHGSASSGWSRTASAAANRASETIGEMRDAAAGIGDRAADAAGRTAAGAADAAGRARSTVSATGASVSESFHRAGDAAAGAADRAADAARGTTSAVANRARDVSSGLKGMTGTATGMVRSAAGTVADLAKGVAGTASGVVRGAADTASDMARGVAGATADTVQGATKSARGLGRSATEFRSRAGTTAAELLRDQPLVAAGIGLAIGALIGAALPATDIERRTLGETSDELKARARQFATEQAEKAKTVAAETYETAKQEAGHVAGEAAHAAQEQGFPAGTLRAEHARNEPAREAK